MVGGSSHPRCGLIVRCCEGIGHVGYDRDALVVLFILQELHVNDSCAIQAGEFLVDEVHKLLVVARTHAHHLYGWAPLPLIEVSKLLNDSLKDEKAAQVLLSDLLSYRGVRIGGKNVFDISLVALQFVEQLLAKLVLYPGKTPGHVRNATSHFATLPHLQ